MPRLKFPVAKKLLANDSFGVFSGEEGDRENVVQFIQ